MRQGGGERILHPELFADALAVIWESVVEESVVEAMFVWRGRCLRVCTVLSFLIFFNFVTSAEEPPGLKGLASLGTVILGKPTW